MDIICDRSKNKYAQHKYYWLIHCSNIYHNDQGNLNKNQKQGALKSRYVIICLPIYNIFNILPISSARQNNFFSLPCLLLIEVLDNWCIWKANLWVYILNTKQLNQEETRNHKWFAYVYHWRLSRKWLFFNMMIMGDHLLWEMHNAGMWNTLNKGCCLSWDMSCVIDYCKR